MSEEALASFQELAQAVAIKDNVRAQIVDSDPCCRTLVQNASVLRSLFTRMVITCTISSNEDPFTRSGEPNRRYQNVYCDDGVIGLVVSLLRAVIADPSGITDNTEDEVEGEERPGSALNVPDWAISNTFLTQEFFDVVMLGFRYCCHRHPG